MTAAAVRIKTAEFAGAVAQPGRKLSRALPQIAISGRSNVGKSSLINRLLGRTRRRLARISATPGKTQEINFYTVRADTRQGEVEFLLADLPGYGYARVPDAVRRRWRPLIEAYLSRTPELRGVVQLVDARHGPSAQDREMLAYLAAHGIPTLFALTKVDKLSRSERARRLADIRVELEAEPEQVVPFSAQTGEGRDELLESLEDLLGGIR